MEPIISRRKALGVALAGGSTLLAGGCASRGPAAPEGAVACRAPADAVGARVLAAGGNAVDAVVASAMTAAVSLPEQCGFGGYGGHFVVAGEKSGAIDFNTAAPAAAREDMFRPDGKDALHGWRAAGVPGVPAGLALALERFGTRTFAELAAPALRLAREGIPVTAALAGAIRSSAPALSRDPASAALYFKGGEPIRAGATLVNPRLAEMIQALASEGVESFYRGRVASEIAREFRERGGLVAEGDLAAYRAREVEPLDLEWRGFRVLTPPPTSGGVTVLQALAILKALPGEAPPVQARVEALRLAWRDRLKLLGDGAAAGRLLSEEYARELAARVARAVKEGKPLSSAGARRAHDGTFHVSAIDARGNAAALTLTHGNHFGACVTVGALGLTLGHGMSRFDPTPGHPNAPGPGKRPLHNMCPTVVLRGGAPVLALGGAGGRRIPNAVFFSLLAFLGGAGVADAVDAARLHTEGGLQVGLERLWSEDVARSLDRIGYRTRREGVARVDAAGVDPRTGRPVVRGR